MAARLRQPAQPSASPNFLDPLFLVFLPWVRDFVQLQTAEVRILLKLGNCLQELEMDFFAAPVAARKDSTGGENRLMAETMIGMDDAVQAGDQDLLTGAAEL